MDPGPQKRPLLNVLGIARPPTARFVPAWWDKSVV